MSDNMDSAMQQEHGSTIAQHVILIDGLQKGQDNLNARQDVMGGDIKTILSMFQANTQANVTASKPKLGFLATCGAIVLSAGLGFMQLVIIPMQEDTDKKRIEQGDRNKLQDVINASNARESGQHEVSERHYDGWLKVNAEELKKLHDTDSEHAILEAREYGVLKGRLDSIENQLNAVDYYGPRNVAGE
jgi:hypothetical protein